MPNKLTDTEIKKAFESCFTDNNNCDECPYYSCKDNRCTQDGDVYTLPKMIIDLINRLETEKDGLQKLVNLSIDTQNEMNDTIAEQNAKIEKQKDNYMELLEISSTRADIIAERNAEIERLKRSNNISQHLLSNAYDSIERFDDFIENIKLEAYKECIEKVKEEMSIWSFDFSYYSDRTEAQKSLDNLWNEFERKESTIYDD